MDPRLFFGEGADGAETERSLLEAVAGEFGVLLPRHAIVNGRLHTFVTRSWTRPPGDGETYPVIRFHGTPPMPVGIEPAPEDGPEGG
ncbi:hypothetical protein ACIBQ5_37135 [Streptomyces massasporeus]|uniref:hypothetical protein n=1 Tax=Streptomyces massasporeus TaxID=67324 RepID=UPI0037946961